MPPGDLLAARVSPWRVADRDLDDARAFSHQLADEFVIKFEPRSLHGYRGQRGPEKGLVAAFVVGEVPSIDQIGEKDDEDVADIVRQVGGTYMASKWVTGVQETLPHGRI